MHPDGRAPGREELQEQGLPYLEFVVEGTSEDAAMLLAYECRAELIVAVGTHATMVEFLDKGRPGMSSTFLTRLRLGPMLIDAKGVSRLYRPSPGSSPAVIVLAAGLLAFVVIVLVTPGLRDVADLLWIKLRVLLGGNV